MSNTVGIEHKNGEFIADLIVRGGFFATSGALAGHFFKIISPQGGAVFGAASGLASPFIESGLNKLFSGNSESEKVVKFIGKHFLNIVAGSLAVAYGLGLSMSITNGVYLSCAIVLTSIVTSLGLSVLKEISK